MNCLKTNGYDENGKVIEPNNKYFNSKYSISSDALALLGQDENVILACSLKGMDWNELSKQMSGITGMSRQERAMMEAVYSYLKSIDGTVAIGFGPTNGMGSVNNMIAGINPMNQFSTTIVVEAKEGSAEGLVNGIKGMLTAIGAPITETSSGFSVSLDKSGITDGTIYMSVLDNTIVIANHPIKSGNGNAVVQKAELSDYAGAFCIGLYKDNQFMKDLKLDYDVTFLLSCKPCSTETEMTLKISGDDDNSGVLAKLAKIVISISDRAKSLQTIPSQSSYYGNDMAYDEDIDPGFSY